MDTTPDLKIALAPLAPLPPDEVERRRQQREALRTRHAHLLGRLMASREDLRGVHALADFVDDSVRWTA